MFLFYLQIIIHICPTLVCNARHFSTAKPYQVCQRSYATITSLQLCSHTHDSTAVMKHSVICVCW